jgi:DNA-damage-inducible protein J
MAQSSLLQIRIAPELKQEAEQVFASMGMDIPSAVRLFFTQTIKAKKLPFEVSCPQGTMTDIEGEPVPAAKSWDDPNSWLNNPLTIGKGYRKITRKEIYDERIDELERRRSKK